MDKNRVRGAGKSTVGKVKEAAGKMTGNRRLVAEGKGDQVAGKVDGTVGKAKDAVRNLVKR